MARFVVLALAIAACRPASHDVAPPQPTIAPAPAADPPASDPPAVPPKPAAIPCGASQCTPPESCLEAPGMDATGPVVIRMCGIRCDPHATVSGCPSEMVCVPVSDSAGPRCVPSKR
jgi:hypothetical protein